MSVRHSKYGDICEIKGCVVGSEECQECTKYMYDVDKKIVVCLKNSNGLTLIKTDNSEVLSSRAELRADT